MMYGQAAADLVLRLPGCTEDIRLDMGRNVNGADKINKTVNSYLLPVFPRKTPMRHETGAPTFRYLIYLPSDIIFL